RATGASFLSVVVMAVLPQVMARFIGFSAYQLDSNLRNSALVGLVGGGGIGATLFTAFQRFDYDFVLTIGLAIIGVVMVGEIVSGFMRRLFQGRRHLQAARASGTASRSASASCARRSISWR